LQDAIRDGHITSRQGTSWTGIKHADLDIRYPKGRPPSAEVRTKIEDLAIGPPPVNVEFAAY